MAAKISIIDDNENILMKSGFVKVDSPSPKMQAGDGIIPDSDAIAKMSWDDINDLVSRLGGD